VFFAGEPVSCPEAICRELGEMFEWRKRQGYKSAGNYKYVLDVSGFSLRFFFWGGRTSLLMGCVDGW